MNIAGTSTTPVLDQFLNSVADLVRSRDGAKLQDFLQIEPPLPDIYRQMIDELRQHVPAGSSQADAELQRRCEVLVPRTTAAKGSVGSGSTWAAFPTFMKLYLGFLRDVNVDNLLETYNLLKSLLNQCVLALGDSQMGVIVLPTVLYLSKVLAKLAMGLDRRPDLIAHLLRLDAGRAGREESVEKVTLVEQSANVVREAFIKCLTDRSGTPGVHGKPEGKRIGIYLMANLCLKLLFQCGKLRNAEQMFASISAQSPPLAYFPASQRVTYLYYLGRYLFSNNLFFPAQVALQSSYDQCHRHALKQRHLILTYLVPCNIIMGRFPSAELLQRPEAQGLAERFLPICRLIIRGDYIAFRQHLAADSPDAEWLAHKGILLPLRNRCEILVWRSLARKVFIHGGYHGEPQGAQAQRGPPPFLYLNKLETAVRWLQSQHQHAIASSGDIASDSLAGQNKHGSQIVYVRPDRDFAGLDADGSNGFESTPSDSESKSQAKASPSLLSKYADYLTPEGYFDALGEWHDNPTRSLIDEDAALPDSSTYAEYQLDPYATQHPHPNSAGASETTTTTTTTTTTMMMMMHELESILASLLTQGLMRGYLTHKNPRFAIPGARLRGAIPTGFPNVWRTISAREGEDPTVPGWVLRPEYGGEGVGVGVGVGARSFGAGPAAAAAGVGVGGGRVVNLKGARPAGAQ